MKLKKSITIAIGLGLSIPVAAQNDATPKLDILLKSDIRGEDGKRDKYRNPIKTLDFFQVRPEHTVIEYGPGGGWYTRILLPYISNQGKYIAVNTNSEGRQYNGRAQEARSKSWAERFPVAAAEWTGIDAAKITAFESDEAPEEMIGKVDRILIFRSMHGMLNGDRSDTEIKALRNLLTDDGLLGVVQHRADANATYELSNGVNGYLKQDNVIALFKLNGFELVKSSEINANSKDPKNHKGGVWTLPPVLRYGDEDRAKYEAIGESDRMTLLFRKAK